MGVFCFLSPSPRGLTLDVYRRHEQLQRCSSRGSFFGCWALGVWGRVAGKATAPRGQYLGFRFLNSRTLGLTRLRVSSLESRI